jgi:hypothetical protein
MCFLLEAQTFLDTLEMGGNFKLPALMLGEKTKTKETESMDKQTAHVDITPGKKKEQVGDMSGGNEKGGTVRTDGDNKATQRRKYLVFKGFTKGQGTGNIISGLLATHLLGQEFNRIVCVGTSYPEFHQAFEAIQPDAVVDCPFITSGDLDHISITLSNFVKPPDECELKSLLESDERILTVRANTYPRWPVIPDNFFLSHYKAKPELLQMLSYDPSQPPTTVVHLRAPDNPKKDYRKGLDDDSLQALGNLLPSDTYLVTNRVELFDNFHEHYQWRHPEWQQVHHSAFTRLTWGMREEHHQIAPEMGDRERETLQMWADWYTILTAKMVYHTHSDFSISAIHWQNIPSKSIGEYDAKSGQVLLTEESWRTDGESAPLVNRKVDGDEKRELRYKIE